jgi:two-component system, LytTR family, sensor kinase
MKKSAIVFLHLGYWLMYALLILSFILAMSSQNPKPIHKIDFYQLIFYSPIFLIGFFPGFIGFYTFYLFIFNRYLKQKRILLLFLVSIVFVIIIGPMLIFLFLKMMRQATPDWGSIIAMGMFVSFLALIHGILGLVMRGFIEWYGDIKVKAELSKKNFEVELALVKSQISPHFLFNTINNIDILIEKDAAKASAYLNQLSDMMRFMLYETKTEKIPLSKEINYIEKYIALQKIRTANIDYISFSVDGDASVWQVEPMLFIPIIENAFKHAEDKKIKNAIEVYFKIDEGKLEFTCNNAYNSLAQKKLEHSGLGNELIQRRLNLLFKDQHEYIVNTVAGVYKVKLILYLS